MNDSTLVIRQNEALTEWRHQQKMALELISISGDLLFNRSIELLMFRRDINDSKPSKVINDHLFAKNYINQPITLSITLLLAKAVLKTDTLSFARIDIGRLAADWIENKNKYENAQAFVLNKLGNMVDSDEHNSNKPTDVVLYGFGRIGRLLARRLLSSTGKGEQLRLKAVVIRPKLADRKAEVFKRFSLMKTDSVHGVFDGTLLINDDGSEVNVNGNVIKIIYANNPNEIDYTSYGISNALLMDNTGVWRDKESLSQHLGKGVEKVILTAPGNDIPNVVTGINQDDFDIDTIKIISAASCTTNAISPVIKVLDDALSIEKGHIESIHAYTSDQNLLDNFHKKPRRGRGAAMNMVLTTTGAAKAVARVLPHMEGLLTGNAVRVPTPNVSLAILNLTVKTKTTVDEVNAMFKKASLYGNLVEQIHYSDSTEYVSSHAVGMTTTSVIDAPSTIVSKDQKTVTIYAWYDNEFGYACQVVRLAKSFANVRRNYYY